MKQDYSKTEHYEMWKEEGVIHVIYAKNLNISLEIASAIVFNRFNISQGKDWSCIVKLNNVSSIEPEAREFLSKSGIKYVSRLAILATHQMDRLMSEVWIEVDKPNIPVRIFNKQCNGLKWLNRYQLKISA